MPVISSSTYRPRFPLGYHHLNTIYPSFFRKVEVVYERERVDTPDGDFLDLDFSKVGSSVAVILIHGLEGSTDSVYIKAMAKAANNIGWDAIGINLRGCSGEPNLLYSAYHSGMTEDLEVVIDHVAEHCDYSALLIVGFSLGGNITLKYMGENGSEIHSLVRAAVGVSVPITLGETAIHLSKMFNMFYLQNFLYSLREKTRYKMEHFPDAPIDWEVLLKVSNFEEFDSIFTGPAHGFLDSWDYYKKASSRQFLPGIHVPTLLINALDDPFLPQTGYPFPEAEASHSFYLEAPPKGGHVGFVSEYGETGEGWLELRVMEFFREHV